MSGFCVIAGEQRLLPPTPLTMHHWVVLGASQVRFTGEIYGYLDDHHVKFWFSID